MKKPPRRGLWISERGGLVALHGGELALPLHALAFEGLLLPVEDGGRLLEEFALLPFPDDPLLLDHALEALDGLLEGLLGSDFDVRDGDSPPSRVGCNDHIRG